MIFSASQTIKQAHYFTTTTALTNITKAQKCLHRGAGFVYYWTHNTHRSTRAGHTKEGTPHSRLSSRLTSPGFWGLVRKGKHCYHRRGYFFGRFAESVLYWALFLSLVADVGWNLHQPWAAFQAWPTKRPVPVVVRDAPHTHTYTHTQTVGYDFTRH